MNERNDRRREGKVISGYYLGKGNKEELGVGEIWYDGGLIALTCVGGQIRIEGILFKTEKKERKNERTRIKRIE